MVSGQIQGLTLIIIIWDRGQSSSSHDPVSVQTNIAQKTQLKSVILLKELS